MIPEKEREEMPETNDVSKNISEIKNITESLGKKIESNERLFYDMNNSLVSLLKEIGKNKEGDKMEANNPTKNELSNVQKTIESFQKNFNILEGRVGFLENDLSVLQGNLMALEQNLSKAGLSNTKQKLDLLQNTVDFDYPELYGRTSELDKAVQKMQIKMASLEVNDVGSQTAEIVNRLVFLESRITAIESMIRDLPKYSPIVVE